MSGVTPIYLTWPAREMDDYSGVSVKVVNNELRIQRVDTGSLQKGSQSVRL